MDNVDDRPTPLPFLVAENYQDTEPRNDWDRKPDETEEEWLLFLMYRDAPKPRRFRRPGRPFGEQHRLRKAASKHQWIARVHAYDKHKEEVYLHDIEAFLRQGAREVAAEHMAMLRDARELCAIEFDRLLERAKEGSLDGTIKPETLVRLMEGVIKMDRLVREQSTSNVVTESTADLSHMSLEDLRTAAALAEKMDPTQH